jgi:hypothetical protein
MSKRTPKIENADVARTFEGYPPSIRKKLMLIRGLIHEVVSSTPDIGALEETLKWGEPSYLAKGGSTVRIAWKKATPTQYGLYFHCQTRLIETFKELYGAELRFEGNRAIVFDEKDEIPRAKLTRCIMLALTYHKRKHLPLLGA